MIRDVALPPIEIAQEHVTDSRGRFGIGKLPLILLGFAEHLFHIAFNCLPIAKARFHLNEERVVD